MRRGNGHSGRRPLTRARPTSVGCPIPSASDRTTATRERALRGGHLHRSMTLTASNANAAAEFARITSDLVERHSVQNEQGSDPLRRREHALSLVVIVLLLRGLERSSNPVPTKRHHVDGVCASKCFDCVSQQLRSRETPNPRCTRSASAAFASLIPCCSKYERTSPRERGVTAQLVAKRFNERDRGQRRLVGGSDIQPPCVAHASAGGDPIARCLVCALGPFAAAPRSSRRPAPCVCRCFHRRFYVGAPRRFAASFKRTRCC